MPVLRLLPFVVVMLLTVSRSAHAQVDRVSKQVQQRVDSLRRTIASRPDEVQAYHDSVLHYLQARSHGSAQRSNRAASNDARTDSQPSQKPAGNPRPATPVSPLPTVQLTAQPPVTPTAEINRPRGEPGIKGPLETAADGVQEDLPQLEQERIQRATALKKEAWATHLLLGSYFQLYRQPRVGVDVSPFMGYRFTSRGSAGVGVSYRVPYTVPLYQARVFAEYGVYRYRGLLVHAEYERSWQPQPGDLGQSIVTAHHLLAGIGITYRITKKVRGATLLLVRPGPRSQPLDLARWNLRTGVYLGQ